jgi:hypothetical protein
MDLVPQLSVVVTDIPSRDGYLVQPPVCLTSLASAIQEASSSSVAGRFVAAHGELHGAAGPRLQDTFIAGTPGRTGRSFDVVSGAWKDDSVSPATGKYRLFMPDGTSGAAFEVVAGSATDTLEAAQIVLGRGVAPVGSVPSAASVYCYLHFAWGSQTDYRLALEWQRPIRLDYTTDAWETWNPVQQLRSLGNAESCLRARGDRIRLNLVPDLQRNILAIEVADGYWLRNVQRDAGGAPALPSPGCLRLVGRNGWATLEYYPLGFDALSVVTPVCNLGWVQPGASGAFVFANALTQTDPAQTNTAAVQSPDGQSFAVAFQASGPNADDSGANADAPPRLSDVSLLIPAVWESSVPGAPADIGYVTDGSGITLQAERVHEIQALDDANRTYTASARVAVNNYNAIYAGASRNFAVDIAAGNGSGRTYARLTGVAGAGYEGHCLARRDPYRPYDLPCVDNAVKLQSPLGQDLILDGWCIWSAVRFLAEAGSVSPAFCATLPLYQPPGAPSNAPYGPAGADCTYPVLQQGSGLDPRYRFLSDDTPWNVLQRLAQDMSEPVAGSSAVVPYYVGFDATGQLRFEPLDVLGLLPGTTLVIKAAYSDVTYPPSQCVWPLMDFRFNGSTAQMRSSIDFQGLDAAANEETQVHVQQPPLVQARIGYRFGWQERNRRFGTQSSLQAVAQSAAAQASLPQITVRFRSLFDPTLFAGDIVSVEEHVAMNYAGSFVITRLESVYGVASGRDPALQDCWSIVTARACRNQ